jgi:CNP1-like family
MPPNPFRRAPVVLLAIGLLGSTGIQAQLRDADPDWQEDAGGRPPSFDVRRLIPVDMPPHVGVRMGIDPETLSIGRDGVVRYVVVATGSGGAQTILYEAIRCSTAQYRRLARYSAGGGWTVLNDSEWVSLHGRLPSVHPLQIARSGICVGATPNQSPADMVRDLRTPPRARHE